ncbi:MAG TPA: hypothetical protein VFY66_14125, partial [Anaerolineales bacterium]|nr:hypothetical protein [Anaerolineales bacterium]
RQELYPLWRQLRAGRRMGRNHSKRCLAVLASLDQAVHTISCFPRRSYDSLLDDGNTGHDWVFSAVASQNIVVYLALDLTSLTCIEGSPAKRTTQALQKGEMHSS